MPHPSRLRLPAGMAVLAAVAVLLSATASFDRGSGGCASSGTSAPHAHEPFCSSGLAVWTATLRDDQLNRRHVHSGAALARMRCFSLRSPLVRVTCGQVTSSKRRIRAARSADFAPKLSENAKCTSSLGPDQPWGESSTGHAAGRVRLFLCGLWPWPLAANCCECPDQCTLCWHELTPFSRPYRAGGVAWSPDSDSGSVNSVADNAAIFSRTSDATGFLRLQPPVRSVGRWYKTLILPLRKSSGTSLSSSPIRMRPDLCKAKDEHARRRANRPS